MQEASKQAFSESIPVNFLNPVSLMGMAVTGLDGSKPKINEFDPEKDVEYKKWAENKDAKRYRVIINTADSN